jgi:serine/threonine-protein kinase HipA
MRRLIVYLNCETVGALEQNNNGMLEFRYGNEWLNRPDAMPLSRSLPLQSEPFKEKKARPFFAGILPDEGPRRKIASVLGISERNDFAMLERIGGECAGAVSLLPEGIQPFVADRQVLRGLGEKELQDIITELPRRPLLAGQDGFRLSLAGAQDKLPVVIQGTIIALPFNNTPSTHIIKPEPEHFPGLAANEFLCMTLAKEVGLNVPPVTIRLIGGKPCIIIERFDRIINQEGTVARIHQEDFCQALGFPPERKYQQEGGPLVRDCITLLREWSTAPVLDIRDFLDGLIFNVLIGNADAHGKNYSMLYSRGERRIAPFYDLVCTLAWPELSKTPAMKIGKSESIKTITTVNWQKMIKETDLGWPMLKQRILDLSQKTADALQKSQLKNTIDSDSKCRHVADIIEERASFMIQGLRT